MIKRAIIRFIPKKLYEPIQKKLFINNLKQQMDSVRKKYGKCIIFIATPLHGNLGDHAIVYAQENFFKERGYGNQIIEIPSPRYSKYSQEIKQMINNEDLIIIDGGGSMGTLWIDEEYKMQKIVKSFPKNPIFIFPQTIYYSKDKFGEEELKKSVQIYNSHTDLYICARETRSYDFMKKAYPSVNILLIPDIVLSLKLPEKHNNLRNGVVFCLRGDKEKVLSEDSIEHVKKVIFNKGLKISHETTVIPGKVTKQNRQKKLNNKWEKFATSQLVITDRLHGMIFAAINNTPCIAFDNSSGKVGNVYKWISNLPYIRFVNSSDNITDLIDTLLNYGKVEYNNKTITPHYDDLFKAIEQYL